MNGLSEYTCVQGLGFMENRQRLLNTDIMMEFDVTR